MNRRCWISTRGRDASRRSQAWATVLDALAAFVVVVASVAGVQQQGVAREGTLRKGGSVRDIDGNEYQTVVIGRQEWMVGNLRTTRLNDGVPIAHVVDGTRWGNLLEPAYVWFGNNEPAHRESFGALYNWYAVKSGKLCPKGWRVPTDADWQTLVDTLGGKTVAGGKLKSTATAQGSGPDISESDLEVEQPTFVPDGRGKRGRAVPVEERAPPAWNRPNTGATNETGFSAVPGGRRTDGPGQFDGKGLAGYWWTSSDSSLAIAWFRMMSYDNSHVSRMTAGKSDGMAVCCVRE